MKVAILFIPFNDNISLQNVAGCSNIRVRQVYSDLDGLYLEAFITLMYRQ